MPSVLRESLRALLALGVFTALCGLAYPALVTAVAQVALPDQANGSLLHRDGTPIASQLVGQSFSRSEYFWPRPSALPIPYDASTSSGSNLGPSNPALHDAVAERVARLRAFPAPAGLVPADLVTASASGLDPHITPAAARFQVPRVAAARGLPEPEVHALVDAAIEGRLLGVLGEPRVNVTRLNIALDERDDRAP